MIKPNTILNDTWEIKHRVGSGSFCSLFLARNIHDKNAPLVAVKAVNDEANASMIRLEGDVMRALGPITTIPRLHHHGQHRGSDYLVMELLCGEDMSKVRNRARQRSSGLVVLPAAVYLARQILRCLRAMHSMGYIHRDVKPANFVRRDRNTTEFCMVDFGLAKAFREKDGKLRMKRENADFRGTTLYASPYAHEGEDQCPRDDVFSLLFVFCDLVCGQLPWSKAAKDKDKNAVSRLKKELLTPDPSKFIAWVKAMTDSQDRIKMAAASSSDSFYTQDLPNFPAAAQEHCLTIIRHLQSLKFEDLPDYDLVDRAFQACPSPQFDSHDVSRVDYSFGGFDWSGGSDITKGLGGVSSSSTSASSSGDGSIGSEMLTSGAAGSANKSVSSTRPLPSLHATHSNGQPDYVQVQRVLLARSRVLGKEIQRVRRLAAANAATATATSAAATTTAATVTTTTVTTASVEAEDGNGMHTTMTATSQEDKEPSMLTGPLPSVSEGSSVAFMQPPQKSSSSTTTTTATAAASPFPLCNGLAGQSSLSLPQSHNSQSTYTPQTNGSSHTSTTAAITPLVPVARCTDLALALTWQEIATELLQVPESVLNQDTLTVIENNLRDAGRFFELDLGPDDVRWPEFMRLQQVVVQFSDLHSRNSLKRHRSSSDAPSGSSHSSSHHGSSSSTGGIAAHGSHSAHRLSSSSSITLSRQNSNSSGGSIGIAAAVPPVHAARSTSAPIPSSSSSSGSRYGSSGSYGNSNGSGPPFDMSQAYAASSGYSHSDEPNSKIPRQW